MMVKNISVSSSLNDTECNASDNTFFTNDRCNLLTVRSAVSWLSLEDTKKNYYIELLICTHRGKISSMGESTEVFDKNWSNLVYINKHILQLLRGVNFNLKDFHLWSSIEKTICHRISIYCIGWSYRVTKKS